MSDVTPIIISLPNFFCLIFTTIFCFPRRSISSCVFQFLSLIFCPFHIFSINGFPHALSIAVFCIQIICQQFGKSFEENVFQLISHIHSLLQHRRQPNPVRSTFALGLANNGYDDLLGLMHTYFYDHHEGCVNIYIDLAVLVEYIKINM